MRLGIDASNLRRGGGVTHLVELLNAADPMAHGFERVLVWSGKDTLARIKDRPWLVKSHEAVLDKALAYRTCWQKYRLSQSARRAGCDVLFVPGGAYAGSFRPMVTMSQNLLPFEWKELRRYGWSLMTLKLLLLHGVQSRTFRRSDGLIFLTRYARDTILKSVQTVDGKETMIPHGVNKLFYRPVRQQLPIDRYTLSNPYRILYVSIIDVYKHQWHVAKAVGKLRRDGFPVVLDLVGPAYKSALQRLRQTIRRVDPAGEFVNYGGPISYDALHLKYARADLCLFASSCENMPIILLEGMASGLPIACSNRGPMPEMLGDAGVYFDPEDADGIARAVRQLIQSPEFRSKKAHQSHQRAQRYSWERCARETFGFLAEVVEKSGHREVRFAGRR